MPRIAGIDIPEKKKIRYALRYIYGIGPKFADDICEAANVDPETRANDLSEQETSMLASIDARFSKAPKKNAMNFETRCSIEFVK